jgi:ribosomal protein S18 acetylase RimI-like enzyme
MEILQVFHITPDVVEALERLIPQLTKNHPPPTDAELKSLVSSDSSVLLVARVSEQSNPIVGILTLVIYRVPTGVRARIEDVVVEQSMRGKGIGELLLKRALEMAKSAGADGVALTSNPRREAANRLYRRLGFKRWETNVYFCEF